MHWRHHRGSYDSHENGWSPSVVWPWAVQHYCISMNTRTDPTTGTSPWYLIHESRFAGLRLPLGCLFDYMQSPEMFAKQPRGDARTIPSIFIEWKLRPGARWGNDSKGTGGVYCVLPLNQIHHHDFFKSLSKAVVVSTREIIVPNPDKTPPLMLGCFVVTTNGYSQNQSQLG